MASLQGSKASIPVSICTNYRVLAVLPVSCEGQTQELMQEHVALKALICLGACGMRDVSFFFFFPPEMFDVFGSLTTMKKKSLLETSIN